MKKEYKPLAEIAKEYGVTYHAVRLWTTKGLEYQIERVVGQKPRRVVNPEDVVKFLALGIKKPNKEEDKG